ncbi:MAG: DUF6941 family protein [Candidatus Binataceae bacterium]
MAIADKPLIAAAFLCERVIQEQDGVLTIVRIVDTFSVTIPPALPPDVTPSIALMGLLAFKKSSPGAEGEKHQVRMTLRLPSGKTQPLPARDFFFKPEEFSGANLILNINLGVQEYGLFRLDVSVDDDEIVARIPFRFLQATVSPPSMIH